MSYDSLAQSFTRAPIALTVITLDYCTQQFGVAPCAGTGEPCYNTFHTCKSKGTYLKGTKDYEFTSIDAPLPFSGPRPYQKTVTLLPTEIGKDMTVKGRLKAEFYDEPDGDIGIDPYVDQRASTQGTYFKKLLARNPNYKGRPVATYEGFLSLTREEFVKRSHGTIDTIKINKGIVTVEAIDGLKLLADIEIPAKVDIKLVAAVNAVATEMTLSTLDGLVPAGLPVEGMWGVFYPAGYIRMGDEIIQYDAIDPDTLRVLSCTRGVFNTVVAEHNANEKVDMCRYYAPANPFDILKEMLTVDCALAAGTDFDDAAFDYWRDWPGGEIPFSALIVEPTKAEKLYFEICDVLDCASWVGEDLRITIRRNMPNEPDRSYTVVSDAAQISNKAITVDLNDASRFSRVILYWDKSTLGNDSEIASYSRGDIGMDPDAESPNDYDERIDKTIYCRWLRLGYLQEEVLTGYIKDFVLRRMLNLRDARPIITASVELKDAGIRTGEYALLQTDELQTPAGMPISERYQVIRRDPKGAVIDLKLQQLGASPVCFIAPDDAPDYDEAGLAEREYGYIADDEGKIDGSAAYLIW